MIERVTCFPNEGTPEVIPGPPSPGDIVRSDGSYYRYTAPPGPPTPQPRVLTWGELAAYLIGLLGGGAAGRAALGAIIASCQAGTNNDKFFAVYFQGQTIFTKAEFTGVLADVSVGIVSAPQKTAVGNSWPVA